MSMPFRGRKAASSGDAGCVKRTMTICGWCVSHTRPSVHRNAVWLLIPAILSAASCRKVESPGVEQKAPETVTTKGGIEMVLIPAGRFQMGRADGEADQAPVHEVRLDAFLMDRYEMTQQQCDRLAADNEWLASNSSNFKGATLPAEMVHWHIAALYCNQRSLDEGLEACYDEEGACNFEADGYRLPTEAEWEYACRAGTDGDYSFGDDPRLLKQYAWFAGNAGKKTHPVAAKKPNAWGLYDMHGNVAEWCNDPYGEDYYKASRHSNPHGPAEGEKYVLRGGSFLSSETACGSAYRTADTPGFTDACFPRETIGFRCVRNAPK